MKKFLLFITLIITSLSASAQCDYVIQGFDSFGDGWNGASIDVDVAGNVTNFSVGGSSASISIPSFTGDNVTFTFILAHMMVK